MADPVARLGIAMTPPALLLLVEEATGRYAAVASPRLLRRIAPGEVLNEAYTWVITVAVTSSAAGSAAAGVLSIGRAGSTGRSSWPWRRWSRGGRVVR